MPIKRSRGDYRRVEEYLREISEEIEMESGDKYGNLPHDAQVQVLLDHFFKGIPQYWGSAEDLRDGIRVSRQIGEWNVRVDTITRRGRSSKIIRDAKTGRIRKWVKE